MNKKEWKAVGCVLKEFCSEYRGVFVSMAVLSVIQGVRPFISVWLTGYLVDAAYRSTSFEELMKYALFSTGAAALLMAISSILLKTFNSHLEYMIEIQNKPLNRKSLEMDYELLEDADIHAKRQRIGLANPRFGLMGSILSILNKIIPAMASCVTALIIVIPLFFPKVTGDYGFIGSPVLSLLFLLLAGLLIFANSRVLTGFNMRYRDIMKNMAPWENRRKFYMDVLAGAENQKDLRIFRQKGLYQKESENIIAEEKKIANKGAVCSIERGLILQLVVGILSLLVYGFAGLRAYVGMVSIGSVVSYSASICKLTDAVNVFAQNMGYLKEGAAYAMDYMEYMNLGRRTQEGTLPLEKRQDNRFKVEFEHVSFKYPGADTYVLKDLNLSFVVGEKMAIVGKNGSGKTTFIKLLCRLYDVTEGCIRVNDIDIRKYDYKEYCRLFSVVFQDFCMFDFPLGENLACSTEVDEKRAMDALERAGLGERMTRLKNGLKTYVGKGFDEEGVNFSGGEKQKMAIARAIYKDAPFVIMDEPTAALDPVSECEVFEGFDRMVGDKTAIYISHRLASCRFCEDILVFDKGKIVQRGSHEELEKADGLYRELWNAQAQYYM